MFKAALSAILLGAISAHALALYGKCGEACLGAVDVCCWNTAPAPAACSTEIFDNFQKCQTCIAALPNPLNSDDALNWKRMRDGACETWSYCNSHVAPLSPPASFTEECASVSLTRSISAPGPTSTESGTTSSLLTSSDASSTGSSGVAGAPQATGEAVTSTSTTSTSSTSTSSASTSSTSRSTSRSGSASPVNGSTPTSRPNGAKPKLEATTIGGLVLAVVASWVM